MSDTTDELDFWGRLLLRRSNDLRAERRAFDAMFRVHYSESGGFDCGFHNEPNPRLDGWFHVQWRESPDEAYEYEPASQRATGIVRCRPLLRSMNSFATKIPGQVFPSLRLIGVS